MIEFDLPETGLNLHEVLRELEKRLVTQALERTDGNKAVTAKLLGIKRTTLVETCRRNGLPLKESNWRIGAMPV